MSTLSNNLQQIYTIKNQIKEVIGTSSDVFAEYPDLIEAAIGQGGGSEPDYNVIWDELIYAPDWPALYNFNENTPFGIYLNDDPSNITYITSNGLKRWSFIDTEGDKIGYVNLWAGNEDGQTEEGIRFNNLMEMYMNPSYTAAITDNTFTIAHGTINERANETDVYDINAYVIAANMILTNNEVNTIDENGVYGDCQWYLLNDVNVAASVGSAYFYLIRNPEEENEEIFPFENYTAITRYPCFGYNFGNFEYTQGEGAQQIIVPISSEEEGVDKYKIKAQIVSPLFVTSEGGDVASPVDIYVGGPSTIYTANDSAEAQVMIGQVGTFDSETTPDVYIARNVSNLELYIEKTNEALPWSARWEWS